jgi:alkylation response protein AidB-like acyl-CoA dehydrogenase
MTAAQDLVPMIKDLRLETEVNRRVADPIVERLIDSRLCRMTVVPELGGLGLSTVEALDVYETLAGVEPSVSWITWNNSLPCLFSRFLSESARSEIFADPTWLYASSTRPSGRAAVEGGGYRINGRWSLVSGCELAEWVPLMCLIEEEGELQMLMPGMPEMRLIFLRKGQFEILDTWHVGGLRGTGSHDVVVENVLVPREQSVSPADAPTLDHPIGRVPIICTLAVGFASQALGIAQTALEVVVDLGKTKVTPDPMPDLRDRPAAQAYVAGQSVAVDAARNRLHECTARVWEQAAAGNAPSIGDIADAWAASLHADGVARDTVDAMYATGGTSSLYIDSPLERAHRDIHAMLRHVIAQPVWLEQVGRVRFGLAPTEVLFGV